MAQSEEQPTRFVSAFIPQAMRSALEESAREHDRSLSGEIRVALRQYFADQRDRAEASRSSPGRAVGGDR